MALVVLPIAGVLAGPREAAQALHASFEAEWDYQLEQSPTWASSLGDRRWNDRWEDLSPARMEARHQHDLEVLARLAEIDRGGLSALDQLNYDLFRKQYATAVEEYQYHWYLVPLNQREGIQTADDLSAGLRFETVKDYEDWIARLRSFPLYMDQTIALMREGIQERMLLPKVVMQRIPAQIDKQIVILPSASPFFRPFKAFSPGISKVEQERLARAGETAVRDQVVPAFKRLKLFFVGEYLPASFDRVGAWQMPNGDGMYAYFVRKYTTTSMTPQQIHDLGQREVARIRGQMQTVIDRVGFKGNRAAFFKHLRTARQFYFAKPDELLMAYRALAKQVDPNLVKIFELLPRLPYGVEAIPENIAPDTTTAYYREPAADGSRAGTFFVNLYKPETRPKYEMMALALHESVPGHHLQIALAMEQGELPKFRRYTGYTAFVEGWGLYAESLGEEMGLYDDPYAKFGQLTYEMWRAVRLVVDTGIHSLHWDRQKAIDFFLENAAKSELDVVNEVDRYIAWPGQALAYKVGELKIKELRARARESLKDDFDLRRFHRVVLESGALPLDILERNVDAWIEGEKCGRKPNPKKLSE